MKTMIKGFCPRMVNAWIPISGVNRLAGLGLAPGSHLLSEEKSQELKLALK